MTTSVTLLAGLNLLALLVLGFAILRLRSTSNRLATELSALAPAANAMADYEQSVGHLKGRVIAVEILNPMELAARQSRFADMFGNLSPGLIRKIVYERTEKILLDQLREYGVQADVKQYGS